ncbi:hypothetical protein LCGC14_2616260, partial [marine sediment metagenome]
MKCKRIFSITLVLVMFALISARAQAIDTYWTAGTGDWSTG